jgi:LPXTG-motif cell wall-anchored protein
MGLVAVGENPQGEKFTRTKGDLVTALISFKGTAGQYKHELKGENNYIATEQTLRALYSLQQYNETGKFDFYSSDINAKGLPVFQFNTEETAKPTLPQTGSFADNEALVFLGLLLVAMGAYILNRSRKASTLNK